MQPNNAIEYYTIMDIRKTIEEKLRAAGMTKRELCNRCGIQHANNINTMLDKPSWPTLEKIAAALGVTVSELVRDGQEEKKSDERPDVPEITCPRCGAQIRLKVEEGEE